MRRAASRGLALLTAVGAAAATSLAATCDRPMPDALRRLATLPPLAEPPPIHVDTLPPDAPVRITLEDVRFSTRDGSRASFSRLDARVRYRPGATGGTPEVEVDRMRLASPHLLLPAQRAGTAAHSPADDHGATGDVLPLPPRLGATPDAVFRPLGDRRLLVDRLEVRDGEVGAPTVGGGWAWRLTGLDVDARDIRVGGGLPEGGTLVRATATAASADGSAPVRVTGAAVARGGSSATARADASVGGTRIRLDAEAHRKGPFTLRLDAPAFDLADLHALVPRLPTEGRGTLALTVRSDAVSTRWHVDTLSAAAGSSRVDLAGSLARGRAGAPDALAVDSLRVLLHPLVSADLERLAGTSLPGGGRLEGRVSADGTGTGGVALEGRLEDTPTNHGTSIVRLDGGVTLLPRTRLDLRLAADPLRARDTAFVVRLAARGPPDSVALQGTVELAGTAPGAALAPAATASAASAPDSASGPWSRVAALRARFDALLRRPKGAPPEVSGTVALAGRARLPEATNADDGVGPEIDAEARGSVVLDSAGPVDVSLRADSLPLGLATALAPGGAGVRDVQGWADARLRVTGTLSAPRPGGYVDIAGGAATAPASGVRVHDLHGRLRVDGDWLVVDSLRARARDGRVAVTGRARLLDQPHTLELALRADSFPAMDLDTTEAIVSADLTVGGTVERAAVGGNVDLLSGRIHEDAFTKHGAMDLKDPPYADLAARVPWVTDSRLRRAAAADTAGGFPVDADVRVHVSSDFRIWDEDSSTGADGTLRLMADSAGPKVAGILDVDRGFYEFYGKRFQVVGGAFAFEGPGVFPHITLLADYWQPPEMGTPADRVIAGRSYPEYQFLARGSGDEERRRVRRPSIMEETQIERSGLLLYGHEPDAVTGWTQHRFFRPTSPKGALGQRGELQMADLIWSYIADEGYDYIPIDGGVLRSGWITVGSAYPGPQVVGALLRGSVRTGLGWLLLSQPLDGGVAGIRLRHTVGEAGEIDLFDEPTFLAAAAAGEDRPGFRILRRRGVRLRWIWW